MNQKAKTYGMIAGAAAILAMIVSIAMVVTSYSRMKAASGDFAYPSFIQSNWLNLFFWVFMFLFGLGLMIDNLLVSQIARGGALLVSLISFGRMILRILLRGARYAPLSIANSFLGLITAALVLIAVFLPGKTGRLMGFMAMGSLLIGALASIIQGIVVHVPLPFFSLALIVAYLVMNLFTALYLGEKQKTPAPAYGGAPGYAGPSQPMVDNRSPLEKLAWLQDMLARGYMEQQEYEEKKNEILDVDMPVSDKLAWHENLVQKGYMTRQEYDSRREVLLRNYMGQ